MAKVLKTEFEYIRLKLIASTGRTTTWIVLNKNSNSRIAVVKWLSAWRQYSLFPDFNTAWSAGCLEDILAFINALEIQEGR